MRRSQLPLLATVLLLLSATPAQVAYLVDSNIDTLFTVDLSTGAATAVGSTFPMTTPCGLAHDGTNLISLDLAFGGGLNGGLYTLSTSTGAPTALGATGLSGWQDICFDATTGQFFAVNQNGNLYTISPTGTATLIGPTPATYLITAIAVDATGTLWGINYFLPGALGTINKTSGAFTVVAAAAFGWVQGMAFHPTTGVLYATNTQNHSLYTINTTTGAATLIGAHYGGVTFGKGFTIAGTACPTPVFQVNSVGSRLNFDSVVGTVCSPAVINRQQNTAIAVNFLSGNTGFGHEVAVTFAALVPLGGGGLSTPGGQIFNVNFGSPGLLFLYGGAAPSFATPFPGNFSVPFVTPASTVTISAQMVNIDPVNPDGYAISQGCQLNVL